MIRTLLLMIITLSQGHASFGQNVERKFDAKDMTLREVAKDLRCPTCQGISVLESDADFSRQIKNIVAQKLNKGESKQSILKYFSDRYGPWILREPPKKGFNALAWYLPIALLVLGPVLIYVFVARKKQVSTQTTLRSTEEIIAEMKSKLSLIRNGGEHG